MILQRILRLLEETMTALASKAKTPAAATKAKRPVTLKHLAAALAEEHQLTKRAGEALVCTENLNPDVMVMKSAKDRV